MEEVKKLALTEPKPKRFLSAAEILASQDLETVDVEVPEWGGTVRLRAMSGEEATKFVDSLGGKTSTSAVKVVMLCAIDEEGNPLVSGEQLELLAKKSLRAILRLQKEVLRINGMTDEAAVATKNV